MGIFSKIKYHVKNITKGAKQRAQEEKERIEKETEEKLKRQVEKNVHNAKTKAKGLIKKGKKKKK